MKSSKILILFIFNFFLSCAGKSVRMTEAETNQLITQNPSLVELLKTRGQNDVTYRHSYVHCDSKRNKTAETCYNIECFGLENPIKCFKTPMTDDEFQKYQARFKDEKIPSYKVSQYRDSCYDGEKSTKSLKKTVDPKIQNDCFTYLTAEYDVEANEKYLADYEKAANIFCNMVNSYCRKNGAVFGNAGYNQFPRNVQTRGMTIKFKGQKYSYEFGLSRN